MTKDKALYQWWQRFGIPMYPTTALPPAEDITFPYGTYEPIFGYFGDVLPVSVKLYFRTESEAIPNAKAKEIGDEIGDGGAIIHCDNGFLWVKRGSPFVQGMLDPDNQNIKMRYLQITIDDLTTN